jgi:hypothetical protein
MFANIYSLSRSCMLKYPKTEQARLVFIFKIEFQGLVFPHPNLYKYRLRLQKTRINLLYYNFLAFFVKFKVENFDYYALKKVAFFLLYYISIFIELFSVEFIFFVVVFVKALSYYLKD